MKKSGIYLIKESEKEAVMSRVPFTKERAKSVRNNRTHIGFRQALNKRERMEDKKYDDKG